MKTIGLPEVSRMKRSVLRVLVDMQASIGLVAIHYAANTAPSEIAHALREISDLLLEQSRAMSRNPEEYK